MDELVQQGQDDGVARGKQSARIVPLRRREDGQRAERIAHVADAFARLRGSVLRFIAMLDERQDMDAPNAGAPDARRFDALLQSLASGAERAEFRRLPELRHCIERVGAAERYRDVIFLHSPPASDAELRDAATVLELLDAELVGLCVAHVLAGRAEHPLPPDAASMPRSGRERSA
ncbi:hypothetical protein WJ41_29980 [Burkholderia ubonensis]|uniref:hypothetical protein n=1 Tax=Burkholderia ubonensis TaxID=101571 RepID=UPI0007591FF5|nr:hypothetical protein [Burkholderia ubonensis]KVH80267.1 hypothetical protein WJ41_29980 [Burkholderia ubonensis]KVT99624.1 hypothetical protein WK61_07830 [Burkholderia ubonensis]KVU21468.1 hypothetical protein WK62_19575 [Burkholderia ubonensis]